MREKSFEELEKMDPKDMTLHEQGLIAFQRAVDDVYLESFRLGHPVSLILDGKLQTVKVQEIWARNLVENLYGRRGSTNL